MERKVELCTSCALKLKDAGIRVKKVEGGIDHKVTCGHCGKRRYGGTYVIGK